MKKRILLSVLFLFVLIVGCTNNQVTGESITLYKSPSCGCCGGHAAYLTQSNFDVNIVEMKDLSPIKEKYNIPFSMQSCHTTEIGNYFVEGHVPLKAIEKLLEEQPDIDGIALPQMPAGSPGMPGTKQGTWTIYALKDGIPSTFMTL